MCLYIKMFGGFKAKNNSNTTGEQWEKKYKSKGEDGKKWARKHYNEIWLVYVEWKDHWFATTANLSGANYQELLGALEYATDTLRNLFQGKAKPVPWDDLARTWNASIIVKRYIAGKGQHEQLKKCAMALSGTTVVYGYKLKF